MAELQINIAKIKKNISVLSSYLKANNIKWSLITKVFSGDKEFMKLILTPEIIKDIHSVGDSRLSSLKKLKELNGALKTIYIKPPPQAYVDDVVKYADISLNSSFQTITALNKSAKTQNKIHEIIIMVELGELREGVNRDDLSSFYEKVFDLSNIKVVGLGSNLGCMYGVEPTYDKLMQLNFYKELIEAKYGGKLDLVSGGSSITLPLIENGTIPKDINHFRIGEAVFFGTSPLKNERFLDLSIDIFNFYSQIIELEEKDIVPDGIINNASIGHSADFKEDDIGQSTYKAILDFGLLDVDRQGLEVDDKDIKFVGITSDMTVIDIGDNKNDKGEIKYRVGDMLCLEPNYIAVARLLNSKFIEKKFIT
ncbi:MAG: alanine racemase [Ignavibacteriales bacterium]|nr:alanine racemase [Ignavibacteriales bacterium]MCF8305758.1 alanine racemase [Ignavibacteriales bacterium]MCF8315480.1 alanine racemase [Ignavibacteriales bacterium]MCF8436992.1 alanine racemase [Ignavibacteriales bacterium]